MQNKPYQCLVSSHQQYQQTTKMLSPHSTLSKKKRETLLEKDTQNNWTSCELGCNQQLMSIAIVKTNNRTITSILNKNAGVFNGLGKLKNYQLQLHINQNVTPIQQSTQRIPYHPRIKVGDKIKLLQDIDTIN